MLLRGLLDRYLYYEESTRDLINADEFRVVFAEDTMTLVDKGFMKLFAVAKDIGRLVMVFLFVLVVCFDTLSKQDAMIFVSLVPVLALPPVMLAYMWTRQEKSEICRENVLDAKIDLVHYMNVIVEQISMVNAYFARPLVLHHCRDKIETFNGHLVNEGARIANDVAFFGWLQKLVTFLAVFLGGVNMIYNNMDISTFTSVLSALTSSCALFRGVYISFLDIHIAYPCLWHLVEYLNVPTDLKGRLKTENAREDEFKDRLRKLSEEAPEDDGEHTVDQLDITLKDVAFSYFAGGELKVSPSASAGGGGIRSITMQIKQGQLIAITGAKSAAGCKTLTRLLAGQLLPQGEKGGVDPTCTSEKGLFVSPHLRVLRVAVKPTLWDGSIAVNVFFGLLVRHGYTMRSSSCRELKDFEIERGLQICRRLRIPDDVIELLRDDLVVKVKTVGLGYRKAEVTNTEKAVYGYRKTLSRISASTRSKIQLACALISDPPVLVLDKPLQYLSMEDAAAVMECLREFVTLKGLEKGDDKESTLNPMLARRPRTVVISTSNKMMLTGADLVVTMNEDGIVSERADVENIANEMEDELKEIHKTVRTDTEDMEKRISLAAQKRSRCGRVVTVDGAEGSMSI